MNRAITTLLLLLSTLSLATPVLAQGGSSEQLINTLFSELEQHAIRDYFQASQTTDKKPPTKKKMGKGKSKGKKSKGLPPGLPSAKSCRQAWPNSWSATAACRPDWRNVTCQTTWNECFRHAVTNTKG